MWEWFKIGFSVSAGVMAAAALFLVALGLLDLLTGIRRRNRRR